MRLIATSDLHGQLLSYDYYANRKLPGSGLARIACLIRLAQEGAPASLLLDNGDFLQGGALTEPAASRRGRRIHPAIQAFNTLGYDAVALGNHEFDYGLSRLAEATGAANFPVLATNVVTVQGLSPLHDQHLVSPVALIPRMIALPDGSQRQVTIGLLGLTPPETMQWNARHIDDRLNIRGMEETARIWVPELRRRGADLVVCLAHTGIAQQRPHWLDDADINDARAAAIAALPGVDAVIAGHSHLAFPDQQIHADPRVDEKSGHIAGIPVVQPGNEGSHLGVIDLWLRPADQGWQVARSKVHLINGPEAVAGMPARAIREAAAPLTTALAQDHAAALFRMRQHLGTATEPLSTWFANIADSQALRLIGRATTWHTRNRISKGPLFGVPIVSLVSAYRSGGRGGPLNYSDIAAGPISLRHVFGLYPFPNTLTALLTTGAGLAARLDMASALFNRITPGLQDQMLINPSIPAFSFETAVGASYRIDLSCEPTVRGMRGASVMGGRIRDLRIDGRRIASDDPVVLVTNNHVTDDPRRPAGRVVLDEGRLCTDIIADYIRKTREITPDLSPGWRFEPMPGTSVLFDSGSGAELRTASASALRPEALGLIQSGFSRFRLHL
nr:metallophosphoesterase [Pseudogemmobacter hezensis]